ncbi:MAG TPA: XdhC family protein [Streptosporangiaceae bacterium]|jgi:xanthine/CO dehydrogenase XdhC/CoxF family maturation factor|nr:XdhC family protein [Streptosporangiaceae bacterium]
MAHEHEEDPACAVAHGTAVPDSDAIAHGYVAAVATERTLVAVFASPVAGFLLRFGADLGFRTLLLEPDGERAARLRDAGAEVVAEPPAELDEATDVVVTDHHRAELGVVLRDVLKRRVRWVGVMGNPRHEGPHVRALTELGVPAAEIARVHRPIGLNIGSRTPPEIAVATLAGLIADRTGSPGGFDFRS